MPLMKLPFFSDFFKRAFRFSLHTIDSVTDVTGLKLPKYSLMQDPEVTWSLWQGQRWQEETSQHQRGAQVHQRRPRARRGAQAQAHTHWTHRCQAAAPSRAHSGEATQSTHEHQDVEESGQYRKLQTWRLNSWHDTNCQNFISLNLSSSVQPRVENGVRTPSQPTTDLGFHPQAMESAHHPSAPSYPALSTPASSCVDSNSSSPSYPGTTTPSLSYLGSNTPLGSCVSPLPSEPSQITISHGSPRPEQPIYVVDHPNLKAIQQCSSAHQGQDVPRTGQQMSATNGFDLGVEALGGSPILGQRLSKGAQGSPALSRQTSLGQGSQQSPVLNRQPPLGQPVHGSPVLSRHPSVTQPQAHAVLIPHASILQVSQRSPSLDRHPMHSGYTTPDERHGNLSRQSSSSGYQGPPTPTFPISPAAYQDDRIMGMGVGFRQGSPAPVVQPQLPEKRRMSSGDKPNGTLSYGTMNGRIRSPASGGSTPSYFHTLSDFSRFNIPGKSAYGCDVSKCIVHIRYF